MSEATDLVQYRLNVKRIVALDIAQIRGPAVVRSGVRSRHWRTPGELGQSDRNRINLGPIKIVHSGATGTIGPFVGEVLVRPGGVAAVGLYDFKDGIHPQILMGKDRVTTVVRIARQKVRVDASAAVDLG